MNEAKTNKLNESCISTSNFNRAPTRNFLPLSGPLGEVQRGATTATPRHYCCSSGAAPTRHFFRELAACVHTPPLTSRHFLPPRRPLTIYSRGSHPAARASDGSIATLLFPPPLPLHYRAPYALIILPPPPGPTIYTTFRLLLRNGRARARSRVRSIAERLRASGRMID